MPSGRWPPPPKEREKPGLPRSRWSGRCALFAGVLGLERIGAQSPFFGRGGDSIMALQLVSRARRTGIEVTSREVFPHPTVAALAEVAGELREDTAAEPAGTCVGELPLTPVVAWSAEQDVPTSRFRQSVLLRTPADASYETLAVGLRPLIDHHDALRLRLHDGRLLEVGPPGTVTPRLSVAQTGEAPSDEQRDAARDRLDPAAGVLHQAVCTRDPRGGRYPARSTEVLPARHGQGLMAALPRRP
nr:phosphopantetheine-binding protein [Streptomyces sp. SID8381]